jgi:hypothetical protein
MSYLCFSFFFSTFDYNLRLLVIYLTIAQSISFNVSKVPSYAPLLSSFIPVTTRLQAKHLPATHGSHSFTITSGSPQLQSTSTTASNCNPSTTTSSTVSNCITTRLSSSFSNSTYSPLHDSPLSTLPSISSTVPFTSEVSKFQNLEFSNNALFDPGIDLTPSQNSSVFKFDTMETDCQDDEDHPSVSP